MSFGLVLTGPPAPRPPDPPVDDLETAALDLEAALARYAPKTGCPLYLRTAAEKWLTLREGTRA